MNTFKSVFIVSLLLVFICNCSDKPSENVLSEEKMVNILVRIHIAESKVNNAYLQQDTAFLYYRTLEDSIYTKYGTNKADFLRSFEYYVKRPLLIDKIYTGVVDTLGFWESIEKIN